MVAPEKVQHRQSRSETLDVEELEHVAVGDLAPTCRPLGAMIGLGVAQDLPRDLRVVVGV